MNSNNHLCSAEKVAWDSYCIISVTLIFRDLFKFEREAILCSRKMECEVVQLLTEKDLVRET